MDTKPGHSAQVDFGYAGYRYDPKTQHQRKAWMFVMVLGYSRHQYVEYVFDQKAETWVKLHVNTFKELGAVPAEIVPDNLKAAVLKAAFSSSEDTTLNRSYRELARHYGFKIAPTPPRAPKKKGKVESGVKYANNNFGKGRDGEDISVSNVEARRWVREIAGTRIHGSTGRAPLEMYEQRSARQCCRCLPSRTALSSGTRPPCTKTATSNGLSIVLDVRRPGGESWDCLTTFTRSSRSCDLAACSRASTSGNVRLPRTTCPQHSRFGVQGAEPLPASRRPGRRLSSLSALVRSLDGPSQAATGSRRLPPGSDDTLGRHGHVRRACCRVTV